MVDVFNKISLNINFKNKIIMDLLKTQYRKLSCTLKKIGFYGRSSCQGMHAKVACTTSRPSW